MASPFDVKGTRDLRHHRPQRRGQDHGVQLHQRLLPPHHGRHPPAGDRDIAGQGSHTVALHGLVRTFQNVRLFKHMTALENLLVAQHRHLSTNLLPGLFKTRGYRESEAKACRTPCSGWTTWACANLPTARPATWPTATSGV